MATENQKVIFAFYDKVVNKNFAMSAFVSVLKDKIEDGTLDGSIIISKRFNYTLEDWLNKMSNIVSNMNTITREFYDSEVWLKVTDINNENN